MLDSLLLGLNGPIVSGFFSMTVSLTIFGCTAFKFCYNHKF